MRLIAALAVVVLLASCASDGVEEQTAVTADENAVEAVVRASIESENDKDVDDFLALWTDEGLKEYDVGTRADLEGGKTENFGGDPVEIHEFAETTVNGDRATTTVDVTPVESQAVTPVNRVKFELVLQADDWLLNGFEFVGGAPPAEGAEVVDVKAREYEFELEETEVSSTVAFKFSNEGEEPHEITLFKGPRDLDIETAAEALKDVDGSELNNVPPGYRVDHIAFAEPGKSTDVSFAEELGPGTYVLACYIPEGGFPEDGEEHGHDSDARTHFELGMRALLTVK